MNFTKINIYFIAYFICSIINPMDNAYIKHSSHELEKPDNCINYFKEKVKSCSQNAENLISCYFLLQEYIEYLIAENIDDHRLTIQHSSQLSKKIVDQLQKLQDQQLYESTFDITSIDAQKMQEEIYKKIINSSISSQEIDRICAWDTCSTDLIKSKNDRKLWIDTHNKQIKTCKNHFNYLLMRVERANKENFEEHRQKIHMFVFSIKDLGLRKHLQKIMRKRITQLEYQFESDEEAEVFEDYDTLDENLNIQKNTKPITELPSIEEFDRNIILNAQASEVVVVVPPRSLFSRLTETYISVFSKLTGISP